MVYLFNFNITYILILATCFDSYVSCSGINFKKYCTYCFYSFTSYSFCISRTIALEIPNAIVPTNTKTVRRKTVKQYVQYFLKLMPEDDS